MGVDTTVKVASLNMRRSTILTDIGVKSWTRRRPYMRQLLQKVITSEGLDVVLAQECTDLQATNICNDLGGHWGFSGGGDNSNSVILYNEMTMEPVPNTLYQLPFHPGCTIQQLRPRPLGEPAWFVAAHLVQGKTLSSTRQQQIRIIGRKLDMLPDNAEVIMGSDLNDPTSETTLGLIRGIARAEFKLDCIRHQLSNTQIAGESIGSSHHFNWAGCLQDFRWIDDVLVRPGAKINRARLFHTCRDFWDVAPTDHNLIWAEVTY